MLPLVIVRVRENCWQYMPIVYLTALLKSFVAHGGFSDDSLGLFQVYDGSVCLHIVIASPSSLQTQPLFFPFPNCNGY